jgi:hypothetical protein
MESKEFTEATNILQKLQDEEEKKGVFTAVEGDIDRRGPEKKTLKLHHGFDI